MSEKISDWLIKSKKSEKIIGFGAEILKDDKHEWTLEAFRDEKSSNKINLRLIFQDWELHNNPEMVNFKLNPKLTKKLIKSLKKQLKAINRKKKKRGK